MRKLYIYLSVISVVALMTSCLGEMESHYTPRIYCSSFYVNPILQGDSLKGAKDTLILTLDMENDTYVSDTVELGDTIMFASTFYTVSNNLVAVKMDWDTTMTTLWFPLTDAIQKVLTDRTDMAAGNLYFNPGYNTVAFPIYLCPMAEGKSSVVVTVESDSKFPTSSLKFAIPVRK